MVFLHRHSTFGWGKKYRNNTFQEIYDLQAGYLRWVSDNKFAKDPNPSDWTMAAMALISEMLSTDEAIAKVQAEQDAHWERKRKDKLERLRQNYIRTYGREPPNSESKTE